MKKFLAIVMAMMMCLNLAACGSDSNSEPTANSEAENSGAAVSFTAGTYTTSANGNNGEVMVQVTLSEHKIESVLVKDHGETPGISDAAIEQIPAAIVAAQSLNVDTISGATNTSKAIIEATKAALVEAGADIEAMMQNNSAAGDKEEVKLEDASYDVVILGAGGAGLCAAAEAADAGASVVVVEKMPFAGGNTLLSYAELACPNNWLQIEKGIEDSPEKFAKEMWEGGGSLAKKELVDIIANNATAGAEWLRDVIGVKYQDYLVHEGGHSVPRAVEPIELGAGMIKPLVAYAESKGVTFLYSTKAEEFVMDESGKVTGVVISKGDDTATLTANGGVVLATGGFGANVEMREHYNTRWKTLDASVKTTNSPAIVGDGIVMAEKIGANLIGMEHIQLYPFNNPVTGVFYGIEAPSWSGEGLIYVNKDGNRFVNEVAMRDVRAEGILAQGGEVYAIYNQAVADRLNLEEKFAGEYKKCLDDGVFFKADTLEEVAEKFGINGENLVATMDKYNEGIKNNNDEFGRTTSMVTMEEGPWFILKGVVSVHHTMGGVEINEKAEVMNTNGDVIPGLFAAGEVAGGVHGNNRVGTCAISDITVFGRIAGQSAAAAVAK